MRTASEVRGVEQTLGELIATAPASTIAYHSSIATDIAGSFTVSVVPWRDAPWQAAAEGFVEPLSSEATVSQFRGRNG